MMKLTRKLLTTTPFILLFVFWGYSEIDTRSCQYINLNNDFFQFIDDLSEERVRKINKEKELFAPVAWNDPTRDISVYTLLKAEILDNPSPYVCDAAYVIKSKEFDQSQKAYAIMLMHFVSMKDHIYLLKTANKAYEEKIITDKEVLAELLYTPEHMGHSTNAKYVWLPVWRREFTKHANEVLDEEQIDSIRSGKILWRGW